MLGEFSKVLKPNGIIVLLTARKSEFENALDFHKSTFELQEKYNILVNGKKVSVYVIKIKTTEISLDVV